MNIDRHIELQCNNRQQHTHNTYTAHSTLDMLKVSQKGTDVDLEYVCRYILWYKKA